jgi:hypothetical protein
MAIFIPHDGPMEHNIDSPLELADLQARVGGFVGFIDIPSGDTIVVADDISSLPLNYTATALAGNGIIIYGHAVLCGPKEIA